MTAFVALLRGVNLAGQNSLKMADLKAIAVELGLRDVRTFIASGNLLFTSDDAEPRLRQKLEERLRLHMSRELRVMVRTAAQMAAVVRANPFSARPGRTVQAFFLNHAPPDNLAETIRNQADDEHVAAGEREVYVAYGEKGIGRSRLRIPAAEAGTGRNMDTVARLADLAREME